MLLHQVPAAPGASPLLRPRSVVLGRRESGQTRSSTVSPWTRAAAPVHWTPCAQSFGLPSRTLRTRRSVSRELNVLNHAQALVLELLDDSKGDPELSGAKEEWHL